MQITHVHSQQNALKQLQQIDTMDWTWLLILARRVANVLVPALFGVLGRVGGLRALIPCARRANPALHAATFFFPRHASGDAAALTMDDAPGSPAAMHELLDALATRGQRATFFVMGAFVTPEREDVVARMVRDGHELGNHMLLDHACGAYSPFEFEAALLATQAIIDRFQPRSRSAIKWFRPPCGRLAAWQLRILRAHNFRVAMADVYPLDVALGPSRTDWIAQHVLAAAQPGSIIVLHSPDVAHKQRAHLLEPACAIARASPLRLVTLSELAALAEPVAARP
jgi:peptidoglycan/xylan/chitin deacetylase (PgdA/CDA1 family)